MDILIQQATSIDHYGKGQNVIERLAALVHAVEGNSGGGSGRSPQRKMIATGWMQSGGKFGGGGFVGSEVAVGPLGSGARYFEKTLVQGVALATGAVHEWFGIDDAKDSVPPLSSVAGPRQGKWQLPACPGVHSWVPPLAILSHLAGCVFDQLIDHGPRWVVWIGRTCWPYPHLLYQHGRADCGFTNQCLFVDTTALSSRLWAIDLALRCPAVGVVVADGSGLDMAATRRLQLAAEAGGTMGLLARPAREFKQLSAAATRWRVRWEPILAPGTTPMWKLELMRNKKNSVVAPSTESGLGPWVVEWDHETGAVIVPADVVERPGQAALAQGDSHQGASLKTA